MRNFNREAALWNLCSSTAMAESAARECEGIMDWFGTLAVTRGVAAFGRNSQIHETVQKWASCFRRGGKLAELGDYHLMWEAASQVRGDTRGMLDQPLRSWMTHSEYRDFVTVRIERVEACATLIRLALNNAIFGAESFLSTDETDADMRDYDDGFPADSIVEFYDWAASKFSDSSYFPPLPMPQVKYAVDRSVACATGEEVPWTGVWFPHTGLSGHSLTFAIKSA